MLRWFGGVSDPTAPHHVPEDGTEWDAAAGCWTVGDWKAHEFRAHQGDRRTVAVIGTCGLSRGDLAPLAAHGVPDDVAWRWPGSYTTVEITDDAVRLWTDLAGACPVYTARHDGRTYWASSSRALAGLIGAGADRDWLAAWSLVPSAPALREGRSAFRDVAHVPAGHRLTISRDGTLSLTRVWSPEPRPGPVAERLRAELAAAVGTRLDAVSAPTVDVSGGLDSTALAVLAAEHVKPYGRVTGVTMYAAGANTFTGDPAYARTAAVVAGLAHELIPLTESDLPYSGLDKLTAVTDEPAPATITIARFARQMTWLSKEAGSDCHMTGDGGDSLLCDPPIMLADLVATGDVARAWTDLARWARFRRLPTGPLVKAAVVTATCGPRRALRALADRIRDVDAKPLEDGDIGWCGTDPVPPWVAAETRERVAELADQAAERAEPVERGRFAATMAAQGMAEVGRSARADVQLAERAGVSLHNPFTDSRVVDAYLSIPLDARPGPAEYKPVLRAAMADLWPDRLTARTTKGNFDADHYGGLRKNLHTLRRLASGADGWWPGGMINGGRLADTITDMSRGLPVPFTWVEPVVAVQVWLRTNRTADRVRWRPHVTTEAAQ